MPWHRVLITKNEAEIAEDSATALLNQLAKAYREASLPPGVEILSVRYGEGTFAFLLSPGAYELVREFLKDYNAQPLPGEPDRTGYVKLTL